MKVSNLPTYLPSSSQVILCCSIAALSNEIIQVRNFLKERRNKAGLFVYKSDPGSFLNSIICRMAITVTDA